MMLLCMFLLKQVNNLYTMDPDTRKEDQHQGRQCSCRHKNFLLLLLRFSNDNLFPNSHPRPVCSSLESMASINPSATL